MRKISEVSEIRHDSVHPDIGTSAVRLVREFGIMPFHSESLNFFVLATGLNLRYNKLERDDPIEKNDITLQF